MKFATRKDWTILPMPKQRAQLILDRTFSFPEMERIKRGFIPQAMEQKWFIFFERNRLHIHRSWTGFCIYRVQFGRKNSSYVISRAESNRDPKQYCETDDAYDAKVLAYCIDVGLLGRAAKFPSKTGESPDEDEVEGEVTERRAVSKSKAPSEPPLNGDLLTDEELSTPMGFGYSLAAKRLGLIYLASIPAMEKLLRDHAQEALNFLKLCQQDALPKAELFNRVGEVTDRLAKVLRGEDHRYMAIPWFTDPNQLRQTLYDDFYSSFGDDPELSGWKADPIHEQALCFLEHIVEIADEATDATTEEELLHQFNDHTRRNVAVFLGIPESHYKYPAQGSGASAAGKTGEETRA